MDEKKKRAFREAALGRLVIKQVGLPAAPFKTREYTIARGQFEAPIEVEGENVELDKALVRAPDGQVAERKRTYAEVGREVCSLIEMARGWTPTKPTKAKVVEAADAMEKAAKDLANKIRAFERLHGWIEPPKGAPTDSPTSPWYQSRIGITHEEMLALLEVFISVNASEIRLQARGNDPREAELLIGNMQLIGKIWADAFEELFGQEATEGLVNDTINGGYRGPFIRFGRFVADCAELEGVSDDMLYAYPIRVKREAQQDRLKTDI